MENHKGYGLAADDAISFIRRMTLLKQIGFQVDGRAARDRLVAEFDGEWKAEVSTNAGKFCIKLSR